MKKIWRVYLSNEETNFISVEADKLYTYELSNNFWEACIIFELESIEVARFQLSKIFGYKQVN